MARRPVGAARTADTAPCQREYATGLDTAAEALASDFGSRSCRGHRGQRLARVELAAGAPDSGHGPAGEARRVARANRALERTGAGSLPSPRIAPDPRRPEGRRRR